VVVAAVVPLTAVAHFHIYIIISRFVSLQRPPPPPPPPYNLFAVVSGAAALGVVRRASYLLPPPPSPPPPVPRVLHVFSRTTAGRR